MRTTPLLLLVIFSTMCFSMKCIKETEDCHHAIWLNNQSDKDIYAVCSFDYPDTSMNFQNPSSMERLISAGKDYTFYSPSTGCIEGFIKQYTKSDTLSIFLFDAAEVKADWLSVRQQYKVLRRLDYSIEDLKNISFSIYYQ